ncbi:MAG: hypothetical protein NUV76_12115 [Candidatus Kuenenia sp.]|nr:hypothetical protein [Candidatus Kuenenia sp.]
MSRKSKIEPVRVFLEEAIEAARKEQDAAAKNEQFRDAETYKCFKEILIRALKLCEEKQK